MKTKTLISNASAAIIVALSIVGCQDYDNGFTDKEIAFQEAFKQRFGVIDPEQDWNLATRGTLHVDFNEKTNVKIYSKNPVSPSAVLMANYTVSAPTDLGFDMPEGTEKVYVQVMRGKNMLIGGYYKVAADGIVEGVQTQADENEALTVKIGRTLNLSVFERWEEIGTNNYTAKNRSYQVHMLDNVPKEEGNTWESEDMSHVLSQNKGVFGEHLQNWRRYVKPGILEKDVYFTIQDGGGKMSLTLEYFCTSTDKNHFAYFYWKDEDIPGKSYPSQEDFDNGTITLYGLIENATNNGQNADISTPLYVQHSDDNEVTWKSMSGTDFFAGDGWSGVSFKGTTFHLVYFEGEKPGTQPTLTFPGGTHIGFAVVRDNNKIAATGPKGDSDVVWFSLEDLNVNSKDWTYRGTEIYTQEIWSDWYDEQNFPAAAAFKARDKMCLGFEDWPDSDGGADLNDLMFWVQGDFEDEDIPELFPTGDKPQSWVLAYEDLGNSFDWDYNDVVLKVSHVAGDPFINITPLAAGGTLASHVKLNGKPIFRQGEEDVEGEIHRLLNPSIGKKATGEYTPANTEMRADGEPIRCDFADYYFDSTDDDGDNESNTVEGLEHGFSMTVLGSVKRMGGITLHVDSPDGTEAVIAYDLNDNKNKTPEVICLPGSWDWEDKDAGKTYNREWRWPKEVTGIETVYPDFALWAANHTLAKDWYKNPKSGSKYVEGTFDTEIDKTDPSGGEGPKAPKTIVVYYQDPELKSEEPEICIENIPKETFAGAKSIEIDRIESVGCDGKDYPYWEFYINSQGFFQHGTTYPTKLNNIEDYIENGMTIQYGIKGNGDKAGLQQVTITINY